MSGLGLHTACNLMNGSRVKGRDRHFFCLSRMAVNNKSDFDAKCRFGKEAHGKMGVDGCPGSRVK